MSCVALKSYEMAAFNGFTKRLRPKGATQIVPEYAGYYFRSASFRREVTAMSSLSTRASLNNEMLGRLKMVSPFFARIQANSQESRTLATLRDTLLPKLLSGELSVASLDTQREALA